MKKSIEKFYNSEFYIFFIFLLSSLTWYFKIDYHIYLSLIALIAIVFSFTCKYSKPIIPVICSVIIANIFTYPIEDKDVGQILKELDVPFLIIVSSLVILSFIYFYIKNRHTYDRFSILGLTLVGIFFSFMLTDLFVTKSLNFLVVGLCVLLFYFIRHTTDYYKMKESFLPYFARTMFYLGLAISLQTIIYYAYNFTLDSPIGFAPNYGWGTSNSAAIILVLIIPVASYILFYTQNNGYFIGLLILITTVLLTTSRGAILSLGIMIPFMIINYFRKYHSRRDFFRGFFLTIGFFVLLFILFTPYVIKVLQMLFYDGLNDSGRFELWREAVELFKKHPFLGSGSVLVPTDGQLGLHWFHSTFFDVLGQLGVVGLIFFGLHFIVKYFICFSDRSTYKWFVIPGFLASGFYAMIDVAYFNFSYLIIYVIILATIEFSSGYFSHRRDD